ncbi:MAG: hypothetical protein GYA24_16345 [Candidatus Lokiarchaeota archaeon]|nr:hypothetical protein [Candidatus Lokiarchaeota archaeon]
MFGMDFNLDGLKEKMAELKDKIKVTKVEDGIVVRFTDTSMAMDQNAASLFSPEKLAGLKAMMPDAAGLDFDVEPMDDGFKLKSSDPDATYDVVSKLVDPEYLMSMLEQMMSMLTKGMGGLFGQLGNMAGDDVDDEGDGPGDDDASFENGHGSPE